MIRSGIKQILVLALLCGLSQTTFAEGRDRNPGPATEARIEMARKLLFDSSAAKQVDGSGVQEALDIKARAIATFEEAIARDDMAARSEGVDKAIAMMFEAVAATKSKSTTNKERRDYDNRYQSLETLLDAHERIAREKAQRASHEALLEAIEVDTDAAARYYAAGDYFAARTHLDKAYEATKASLEGMRHGETLTRELKFETAEDEYRYELDRNDTHRMLLTVLLEEKMQDDSVKNRVGPMIDAADELRKQALGLATEGKFEQAIEVLDNSTRELVKAIRGAGVYIPG